MLSRMHESTRLGRVARWFGWAVAVVLAVMAWQVPVAAAESWQAFVTSANGLTQIDTGSDTAESPVLPVGTGLMGPVAIAPDGRTAYVVTSDTGQGQPGVIPFALTASGPVPETAITYTGTSRPGFVSIAITPNGQMLYVADFSDDAVVPIDLTKSTPAFGRPIPVTGGPSDLAVSPDGSTVYALDGGITPIATATNTAGPILATSLGGNAESFALAPDGSEAYVPITGTPYVYPVALPSGRVGTGIDIGASTNGGEGIRTIAITPDAGTAYATAIATNGDPSVVPIDLATGEAETGIDLGAATSSTGSPGAIAITPDGKTVYATVEGANSGWVVPISTATGTPGVAITAGIGISDWAIAITPDVPPVASFTVTSAPPGSATMFDASSSTVQFGSITNYE